MSSMMSPGMSRLRALARRLLPFSTDEPDPTVDDEGPIGHVRPIPPDDGENPHRQDDE